MDNENIEFTIYFKVGVIGMADDVTETIPVVIDPRLSEEENLAKLRLKMQLSQMRLQLSLTEFMAEKLPEFLEAQFGENRTDQD